MNWKPSKWIVVVLNLVSPVLGLLYVGHWRWSLAFLATAIGCATMDFLYFGATLSWVPLLLAIAGIALSLRLVKHAGPAARPWYARWSSLVLMSTCAVVAVVGCRTFLYEPFRIPSEAMAPTLNVGARIIVKKLGFGHFSSYGVQFGSAPISAALARGDIVAFDFPMDPKQTYVKRLVGLPGDQVVYRDGHLYVNGRDSEVRALAPGEGMPVIGMQGYRNRIDGTGFDTLRHQSRPLDLDPGAEFAFRERCSYAPGEIKCTVPPANYFVIGDNRDNSADSRHWGFVPAQRVIGKVIRILP